MHWIFWTAKHNIYFFSSISTILLYIHMLMLDFHNNQLLRILLSIVWNQIYFINDIQIFDLD